MQNLRILPPNLDDRTFDDLVTEAKSLIPRFCPEWTDHNTSDLGITLIELFAWIAEGVIYRLNQVPEKNYIAFLNLLGITRDPPAPAKVELLFTSTAEVVIPRGTQVSTVQTEQEEAVVFETDEDLALGANASGRVSATNALTLREPETLGTSTGEPFQVFNLRNAPLFQDPESDDPLAHLEIQVGGEIWQRVDDFREGNATHYRCNPVTGEISFGNFPTGDPENPGFGRIPPAGAEIVATRYRYVIGGLRGNVPANTVVLLTTPIPGVSEVTNPAPATGGSDAEPLEEALRRAPQELKIRQRAVTTEDYEFLAREATTEVAIVRCLAPKKRSETEFITTPFDRSPGNVHVLIVPNVPHDPDNAATRQPQPSTDLTDEVRTYLDARRVLTSNLFISGPVYAEIAVTATAFVQRGEDPAAVKEIILDELAQFFHPVSGGIAGNGWQIGEDVYLPQVFDAIRALPQVSFVEDLTVRKLGASPITGVRIPIEEHELVCAAVRSQFNITVTEEPEEF